MHHIYHTQGLILGSRNFGEAGKYYSIFTRDLGMVYATAQGVRKMSSKLRFVLQDFAYLDVDLVQGKDFWRVTNVNKTGKLETLTKQKENFKVLANIARLLKRLLAGVEPNEELFKDLINGLSILEKCESKDDLRSVEAIIVLRILDNLGYIGESETLDSIIRSPFEEDLILKSRDKRSKVLSAINRALKETHL